MAPGDHERTIEIRGAPLKLLGLLAAGVAMTATSLFVAFLPADGWVAYVYRVLGWFGVLFFGAATVVVLGRMLQVRGTILTVSPTGIWDRRVTGRMVPWSAIKGVSTWSFEGQQVIVLAVDPAIERTLQLTRAARWSRRANTALGADGLSISTTGLDTSHDELLSLIESAMNRGS